MLTEILTKIESDRNYTQELLKRIDENLLLEFDSIDFNLKGLTVKEVIRISFILGYVVKSEMDRISLERILNE